FAGEGEARIDHILDERHVGHRARLDAVELAVGKARIPGVVTHRLHRDQAYGAALGVLAEQGALRAPQHLDALKIEQIENRPLWTTEVDVVDVNGYAGLEGENVVAEANASDKGRHGRAPAGAQGGDHGAGHVCAHI